MHIKWFEKEIQKIHPDLSIQRNKEDVSGVYFRNEYLGVGLPPEYIYDNYNHRHTDKFGNVHRNREHALDIIKAKLYKII